MPEHLENSQNLVEEVQKYKDWNLIVFCWLMRALLTENSIWGRKDQNQMFIDSIKFYCRFNWIYGGFDCKKNWFLSQFRL
jgi:hypothetical protein